MRTRGAGSLEHLIPSQGGWDLLCLFTFIYLKALHSEALPAGGGLTRPKWCLIRSGPVCRLERISIAIVAKAMLAGSSVASSPYDCERDVGKLVGLGDHGG